MAILFVKWCIASGAALLLWSFVSLVFRVNRLEDDMKRLRENLPEAFSPESDAVDADRAGWR